MMSGDATMLNTEQIGLNILEMFSAYNYQMDNFNAAC